jgi:hypothetical protein
VQAKLFARRQRLAAAERTAREAEALARGTDGLNRRARVQLSLAHVLRVAGRDDEADAALETAASLLADKGNLAAARLLRTSRAAA